MDLQQLNSFIDEFREMNYSNFSLFYDATKRQVFFVILPIVKNKDDAEDIAQDTYVKFLEGINRFKNGTNPCAYLATIARNLAINEFNKKKKLVFDETLIQNVAEDHNGDEAVNNVLQMIKSLNQKEQEIIIMHIINDYSFKDIAIIINKPLSTVLVTYHRAIKKLRKGGCYE